MNPDPGTAFLNTGTSDPIYLILGKKETIKVFSQKVPQKLS